MTKKKELKCGNCIFYKDENCNHKSNMGILIKNRKETPFFIEKANELVKKCEYFEDVIKLQ